MNLLLLTRYGRLGASSRLRAYQYLPYLQTRGWRVTPAPLLDDYYLQDLSAGRPRRWHRIAAAYGARLARVLRAGAFDLVWLEYETFPWLPAFAERLLARRRPRYVVDYDDALYHRYDLHSNPLVRLALGRKIDGVMRRAATVVAGNDYLAAHAHAAGAQQVEILPTVVDLDRYSGAPARERSPFTIGWIGSPSTAPYLHRLQRVLAEFCRAHAARVVVVGARELTLDGVPIETRPWSETTEAADVEGFDVGIMPLPDAPWERGKSGYKLIQYMASARPVIASPVGVNRQLVEPDVNGFLADSDESWRTALEALVAAPALRARLGAAGRRKVETHYCTRITAPALEAILARAAAGR